MADPSPYMIAGNLPFAPSGNPFSQDLGSAYQSAYQSALQQNQANYTNIIKGYQQTLGNQITAQGAIGKGYTDLGNQVQQTIQGVTASQRQAIADAYAQQSGSAQQDLINRGLGNTTVLSSVQRGLQLDKQKADIALSNQQAQLQAGYQAQIGGAGLNYGNQANMQNAAQQNAQLGFMNSVTSQYPNSAMYAQLLQQQGAIGQANANRAQAQSQFDQQMAANKQFQGRFGAGGGGGTLPPSYPAAPTLGPMNPGGGGGYGGPMASVTPFAGMGVNGNPNFSQGMGGQSAAPSYSDLLGSGGLFGGQGELGAPPQQQGQGGNWMSQAGNAIGGAMGGMGGTGGSWINQAGSAAGMGMNAAGQGYDWQYGAGD